MKLYIIERLINPDKFKKRSFKTREEAEDVREKMQNAHTRMRLASNPFYRSRSVFVIRENEVDDYET